MKDIDILWKELSLKWITGVIATPSYICDYMIEELSPDSSDRIIDPCVWHGVFIFALLEYIQKKYNFTIIELYEYFISKVFCVDINDSFILEFKDTLDSFFWIKGVYNNVIVSDFLKTDLWKFDICLWNPPYIRAKDLEPDYLSFLKKEYSTCSVGTVDIYYAFYERAISISKIVSFITPNSFLYNKSWLSIKSMIFNSWVSKLIDFKTRKIFDWVWTYTLISFINGNKWDIQYSNDINNNIEFRNKESFFTKNTKDHNINIYSGIATLSDKSYKVNYVDWKFITDNGFEIEKGLVKPLFKLTKNTQSYILYPYIDTDIMSETYLATNFPKGYEYLKSIKLILSNRDKGKVDRYESWYAYGRRQWLVNIDSNYVIAVPTMVSRSLRPSEVNMSSVLNEYKKYLFVSWYIITWYSKEARDFILSDEFVEMAEKLWRAYPGKDHDYYALSKWNIDTILSKKIKID